MGDRRIVLALAVVLAAAGSAQADGPVDPGRCKQAAANAPATPPAAASRDGTAPGNAGSTGWSGGTGGSNIGTSQNGSTAPSTSYQPAVARGLDPIAGPEKVADRC